MVFIYISMFIQTHMNRKEQLKYCSNCLNRKFDPQQGLICGLTDRPADFVESCSSYEVDERKKAEQEKTSVQELDTVLQIAALPEEVKSYLRKHQHMGYAVFGGLLAAITGAIIWAAVSVITKYQIGWMAIGIGLLVGISVRFFGAGIDKRFGYLGALLAVFSCLLGNLFSQVGFYANEQGLAYMEVLGFLTPGLSLQIILESFEVMDLVFFGIAGYEGFKFAFRKLPENLDSKRDYTPKGAGLRMPLALFSALLIGIFWFSLTAAAEMEKSHYYENGALMSKGKYLHGLAEGEWVYHYENGTLGAKGAYSNGRENGKWEYFDENGKLTGTKYFEKGLAHGPAEEYYGDGSVYQKGSYAYGRMSGEWITRYEDSQLMSKGSYELDLAEGEWEFYHENGQLAQKGNFSNGEKIGLWQVWNELGDLTEETFHHSPTEMDWIIYKTDNGEKGIEDGSGRFMMKHPNGKLAVSGNVRNKKMEGDWIYDNEFDAGRTVIRYNNGKPYVMIITDQNGRTLIENGNGKFVSYYPSGLTEQEGEYVQGLKEGNWISYYEGEGKPIMEDSHYSSGELDGPYTSHHQTGKEAIKGTYRKGKQQGNWKWFTEEGVLEAEVVFEDGQKQGEQVFYDQSGVLLKKEIYKDGSLIQSVLP